MSIRYFSWKLRVIFLRLRRELLENGLLAYYILLRSTAQNRIPDGKYICINLSKNHFGRHLYTFLWAIQSQGYLIKIKKNNRLIKDLVRYQYLRAMLHSEVVLLVKDFGDSASGTVLTDHNLRSDPFQFYPRGKARILAERKHLRIPMLMHPGMYANGFWNQVLPESKRYRAVFFAGNMDKNYSDGKFNDNFEVMSRPEIFKQLQEKSFPIESYDDLERNLVSGRVEGSIVLVDKTVFSVPQRNMRALLNRFDFYLAMPGASKPMCHNVAEAMSVGCIPIIQKQYADTFPRPLVDGENAVFFSNPSNLQRAIKKALSITRFESQRMRENVFSYYEREMTPEAIMSKVIGRGKGVVVYMSSLRPS